MTVPMVIGLRAALCVVVVTLCQAAGQGVAEDAVTGGGIAKPSVEELAIAQKPAEAVADTNTREAMCLMIEFGSKSGRFAAGVFRAGDLAGKPLSVGCHGTGDP